MPHCTLEASLVVLSPSAHGAPSCTKPPSRDLLRPSYDPCANYCVRVQNIEAVVMCKLRWMLRFASNMLLSATSPFHVDPPSPAVSCIGGR